MQKITTLVALLLALVASPALAVYEISDGTVEALYHMEDVIDSSGNGYNLTNTNSISFGAGKLNNSADTGSSNTNKKLTYTAGNIGITTGAFSIGGWFNPAVNSTVGGVFELNDTTSKISKRLFYHGGVPASWISRSPDNANDLTYNGYLTANTWVHLVMVYNGSNLLSLYKDGNLVATSSENSTSGSTYNYNELDVFYSPVYTNYISGKADEVFFISKALSQSDIDSIYNSGTGNEICITAGCDDVVSSSTPTSTSCSIASTSSILASTLDNDTIEKFMLYWFYVVIAFILLTLGYWLIDKFIHSVSGKKY